MNRSVALVVCTLTGLVILTAVPAWAVEPVGVIVTPKTEDGPAASTTYLAWTVERVARHTFHANVFYEPVDSTGAPIKVNTPGTLGFTGGMDGSVLAYEQDAADGSTADIMLTDLATQTMLPVPDGVNTDHLEYYPRLSSTHLLYLRLYRHRTDVILTDRATGVSTVLYRATERDRVFRRPRSEQVNGNYAVWSQSVYSNDSGAPVGGNVWVYDIAAGTTTKIPNEAGLWQYGPSVNADGTIYFGRSNLACGENAQVIQRLTDGTETVIYELPAGRDFRSTYAVDNLDGTTDVYIDAGNCTGRDQADISVLQGL